MTINLEKSIFFVNKSMKNKTTNFKPVFSTTNRITSALTKIEHARGFLDAATLSEEWVDARD
jgi:hypothetical protein